MTYLPLDTPCWGSHPHWDGHTPGFRTSWLPCMPCSYCVCNSWSVSYSCFVCGSYFACDSCYMPCSCCMPYPILIAWLCHPWSLNIRGHGLRAWYVGRVPGRGASSESACGGVLAHLRCSPSSGEDCHLATVWLKRCWCWQSRSLTVANGSGIRATVCTGILFAALACLAWSSISHSLVLCHSKIVLTAPKLGVCHVGMGVVPRRAACHSTMHSANPWVLLI